MTIEGQKPLGQKPSGQNPSGQKPLQVGQVLEGLLESVSNGEAAAAVVAADAPVNGGRASAARRTLWERMMAAVDLKFDGDNDGDVRGKG
jgi:hypothetical protein